jgi:hypothetical protein
MLKDRLARATQSVLVRCFSGTAPEFSDRGIVRGAGIVAFGFGDELMTVLPVAGSRGARFFWFRRSAMRVWERSSRRRGL